MARMYLVEVSDDNRVTWSNVAIVESFSRAVEECKDTENMHNDLSNLFGLPPEKRTDNQYRIVECEVERLNELNVCVV